MDEEDFVNERFKEITTEEQRERYRKDSEEDLSVEQKRKFIRMNQDNEYLLTMTLHRQSMAEQIKSDNEELSEDMQEFVDTLEEFVDLTRFQLENEYDMDWKDIQAKFLTGELEYPNKKLE